MNEYENIINSLSKKGYRITKTRMDIIKCLFDDSHSHTINEIVNHLSKNNKQVNVSSTYNTIEILINEGFIDHRIDYKNKSISYEIINPSKKHFHIYDIDNKKEYLLNLPKNISNEIEKIIKEKLNLQIYNIKIDVQTKTRRKNDKL